MEKEIWKEHPKFPGYEFSTLGRVRSFLVSKPKIDQKRGRGFLRGRECVINKSIEPRIIKVLTRKDGYQSVGIRSKRIVLHKLILETFVGPCPVGLECLHANDIKSDNRLSNLTWGTKKDNAADRLRNGHALIGERHCMSKLTEKSVIEIVLAFKSGTHPTALATKYGVKPRQIRKIVHGEQWRHTTKGYL